MSIQTSSGAGSSNAAADGGDRRARSPFAGPQVARDLLVALLALARGGAPVVDPRLLALELAPGGDALRVELGADRAARLAVVPAVREATLAASASTSAKLSPVPSHRPATRMPGVSISSAPPGSVSSSRVTVVWRPRPSLARTAPVSWRSLAQQRVDERRLAGAGRAEQDRRRARLEQRANDAALAGEPLTAMASATPSRRASCAAAPSRRRRGRSSSARARPARRRRRRAPRTAPAGAPSGRAAAR